MTTALNPDMLEVTGRHRRWIRRALALAAENASGGYRLGAIAVRAGRPLAVGVNRHRNDPQRLPELHRDHWSEHAEDACLRKAPSTQGATVYVARLTPGGRLAMARPCPRCWDKLVAAGVTTVVYTVNGGVECERIRPAYSEQAA
jgi:tRNA(Arg) A34 adenosine deaminase TadA